MKGKRQLENRMDAIGDTRKFFQGLQLRTIAGAKKRVPRKTGHLGRSIVPGAVSDDHALVEARTPYAAAVEFGSKAHIIKPKKGQALAWPDKGGRRLSGRARTASGRLIFAKLVHHPGTKAHPYLVPAAKEAVGASSSVIVKTWNEAA